MTIFAFIAVSSVGDQIRYQRGIGHRVIWRNHFHRRCGSAVAMIVSAAIAITD